MNKYTSYGHRAVRAESMGEAAEVFAKRKARNIYGGRGYPQILNLESWSEDGSRGEYNSFIGVERKEKGNSVTIGKNERFVVDLVG